MTNNQTTKTELRIDEGGRWLLRSTSTTVCLLDLDVMLLFRRRGPGSPALPYDDEWVPLVEVASTRGDTGIIRVGDRHRFLTDPVPESDEHRWWIPRTCTAIEPLDDDA